jgi:hypothetical protein
MNTMKGMPEAEEEAAIESRQTKQHGKRKLKK